MEQKYICLVMVVMVTSIVHYIPLSIILFLKDAQGVVESLGNGLTLMTKIGFQDVFNTSSSVVIIATLLEGFICKGDTLVLNDGNPYMYRNIKIISIEQYRKTLDKFDVIGGQVGLRLEGVYKEDVVLYMDK